MDMIDVAQCGDHRGCASVEMRGRTLADQRRRVTSSLRPHALWVTGEERFTAAMCHIANTD